MIPKRILGATRAMGAPADWDVVKDGTCGTLAIRDEATSIGNSMTSAWEPTPEELAYLVAGGSVTLTIYGVSHPVVWVSAEPAPA